MPDRATCSGALEAALLASRGVRSSGPGINPNANQVLKPGPDGDRPCTYDPGLIELHKQIGDQ